MDPEFVNKYNQVLSRLKLVENFDGSDPGKLPQFLQKIEALMPAINSFDDYYKAQLIGHIKNKCTDRAREAVFTRQMSAPVGNGNGAGNGHLLKAESWLKLKDQLLYNYAERESSYSLIHKIRSAVLDSNIELYYQKMAKLKHRLINRKLTHNDTLYALEDIERITLQVFRDHLPEPTHSMILRRNPKSMEEAYRYIVEVQQQFYTQSGSLISDHHQAATFSTIHKQQSYGVGMGGVGVSTLGLGVGMGAVGLSAYARQVSNEKNQQNNSKSYYNQSAPPVGAGKNHPMFKSNGNPTFKSSFSYNGTSNNSGMGFGYTKSTKSDIKQNYQQQKNQNYTKTSSASAWKK
ncbi:uncharacterized protein LOC108114256 [Drosophila eugracilis]|uniref:uncharacterized protein LOC108114256 n=1 Tax=Drosophila eugracilis TaxID=29029 RepID=UPI0007E6E8E5|nr:uncharacterized protein LOC108114256 [Drosophila eugracilis]